MSLALSQSPAADNVFETLLADIVGGRYARGARLPAERELAKMLGASRPTLREALRRLAEWRLVTVKRGSGVEVRDIGDWSIDVLPAFLRYAKPTPGQPTITTTVLDLLALRRVFIVDIVRLVATRVTEEGIAASRGAAHEAWSAREDALAFARADLGVMRSLVAGAGFLPAVWMLNRLTDVYLDIAGSLAQAISPPDDYLDSHDRFFDALAAGDLERAVYELDGYLDRHDQRLAALLGASS